MHQPIGDKWRTKLYKTPACLKLYVICCIFTSNYGFAITEIFCAKIGKK